MKDRKLVRDLIPTIIASSGRGCRTQVLGEQDYQLALRNKLVEEAQEVQAAPVADLAVEIADVLEVVDALLEAHGLRMESVKKVQASRRRERGGFSARLLLIQVDEPSSPVACL